MFVGGWQQAAGLSLLSPKKQPRPHCTATDAGVRCVYFCSKIMLLFVLGISTTYEPRLRRILLGATLLLLLVTEPYRMLSVVFSGTPVSQWAAARDQGTPNGARSKSGQGRLGKIAAICTTGKLQSLFCVKPAVLKC